MRCCFGPAAEGMSEIGGIAEAQYLSDIFNGQIRVAQIFNRHLHSQIVGQSAEGRVLFAQLPPERSRAHVKMACDVAETRRPHPIGQEDLSDLAN